MVVIDYCDKSRCSDSELTVFTDSFIQHTDWDSRPHCKYHLLITHMAFDGCQLLTACYKTCAWLNMLITSRYSTGVPNRTVELTVASIGGLLI